MRVLWMAALTAGSMGKDGWALTQTCSDSSDRREGGFYLVWRHLSHALNTEVDVRETEPKACKLCLGTN